MIEMVGIVAELAGAMETGHHTEFMRASVREWIREMTGIGVIRLSKNGGYLPLGAFADLTRGYPRRKIRKRL